MSERARRQWLLGVGEQGLQGIVNETINILVGGPSPNCTGDELLVTPSGSFQNGKFQGVQCTSSRVVLAGFGRLHSLDSHSSTWANTFGWASKML